MLMLFFFQAEVGILDDLVTGVQTCALPIYGSCEPRLACTAGALLPRRSGRSEHREMRSESRSEERRVGKECRTRRATDQYNKKITRTETITRSSLIKRIKVSHCTVEHPLLI